MRSRRRKVISLHPGPTPAPTPAHQYWALDFVYDQLVSERPFRVLTVIDKWSRERILLEADFSLNGQRLIEAFDRPGPKHSLPRAITVDNGTEFICKVVDEWTYNRGIHLDSIRRWRPTENGMIESFNSRLRDEYHNILAFESLEDARQRLKAGGTITPASPTRIAWPSDPERVSTERLGSNVKGPNSSLNVYENWDDVSLVPADKAHSDAERLGTCQGFTRPSSAI